MNKIETITLEKTKSGKWLIRGIWETETSSEGEIFLPAQTFESPELACQYFFSELKNKHPEALI